MKEKDEAKKKRREREFVRSSWTRGREVKIYMGLRGLGHPLWHLGYPPMGGECPEGTLGVVWW